jgi:alanine dehydrogenase
LGRIRSVPLYLTETDVAELLTPAEAVDAIEACFGRMAAGAVENRPRYRLRLEEGALAVMAAADLELGYAGAKVYAGFRDGARFVVLLFRADSPELVAVLEADKLGQLRTGAASGVAAKHLASSGATSLGVIGCGWQAESQVACIRAALPDIERVVAYCRTEERLSAFCKEHAAEPGESHQDPAACDVVVTATSSPDPVLRGEWLRPGALVCAMGANDGRRRELDNVVLERAAFVCCDSLDDAKLESADLIEPVGSGVLDWLEVHELQEVVAGEVAGRQSEEDVVVFKSNGLAAWDVAVAAAVVERARAAGAGRELQ